MVHKGNAVKGKVYHMFTNPSYLALLVCIGLLLGFGFSVTNDFTRRPLSNFTGIGVALILVLFPVVFATVRHLERK
jgi:hypothetical protein